MRVISQGQNRSATTALLLIATLSLALTGCLRRTLTITTEPTHALVFLNDREIGRSEVTTDFLWYGDYDVVIRREGYKTLITHHKIKRPWFQYPPFDFFVEVLWPGTIHDKYAAHFVLEEQVYPEPDELIERAKSVRNEALSVESTRPASILGD